MLKFIYGVMGSSKSAQALITRFNYMQHGYEVALLKPALDTRSTTVSSRIGLKAKCIKFKPEDNILDLKCFVEPNFNKKLMIVDECQFCTKAQIEQLKEMSYYFDVFCYGLKSDFRTELFEGSKRLLEIADCFESLPYICDCGSQAIVNARFEGGFITQIESENMIGDKEYKSMCYKCYQKELDKLYNHSDEEENERI